MENSGESQRPHLPVLYQEIIQAIQPGRKKRYLDLTLGAGGHSWALLDASRPDGELLGLDVDPIALALAKTRLAEFGDRASTVLASYTRLSQQLSNKGWENVDGIVIDLGASSMQFDSAERGFSFRQDGPLDMRFDPSSHLTAADIVNNWDQDEIADLIFKYGEERRSRHIAAAIVENRPFESTKQLADLISKTQKGRNKSRLHPATLSFQALRIAVNGELEAIEQVLPQALEALAPGGRFAVISFHSLEDRIVKHFFRSHSRDKHDESQPFSPIIQKASIKLINRKPILPTSAEIMKNPRARSAKLRVIEKILA